MSAAMALTGRDLMRALRDIAALPAVDDAVRAAVEAAARRADGEGVVTRVLRREAGSYVVEVTGEGLFARRFGAVASEAVPLGDGVTPPRSFGPTLPLQGRVKGDSFGGDQG